MSGIMDLVLSQLGGSAGDTLGRQLGKDNDTMSKAVQMALPMLLGALTRNASSASGAQSLNNALDEHDGSILDKIGDFFGDQPDPRDNRMVDHILGGNRTKAENTIARGTGLSTSDASALFQNLAPVLMGALGKQKRSQGLDLGGLASMLSKESDSVDQATGGGMGLVNKMLDADGDGDVDMGDLAQKGLGMLGGLLRR